jgi:hypothetical protein
MMAGKNEEAKIGYKCVHTTDQERDLRLPLGGPNGTILLSVRLTYGTSEPPSLAYTLNT